MRYYFKNTSILIVFYTVLFTIANIGLGILGFNQSTKESTVAANQISDDSDAKVIIIVILFLLLLLFLDVWSVLEYWINSKKEEWKVRKMYGADKFDIYLRLNRNFIGLICVAYGCAFLLSVLFQKWIFKYGIDMYFQYYYCGIVFLVITIIGIILNQVLINKMLRKYAF